METSSKPQMDLSASFINVRATTEIEQRGEHLRSSANKHLPAAAAAIFYTRRVYGPC